VAEPLPWTLSGLHERARATLSPGAYGYFAGGAGDEATLADNVAAWQRIQLRQRVLVDVSRRDPGTSFLGSDRPHPFVVAPMAFQAAAHPGGEPAFARGAAAAGAPYCLSTLATTGVTELAADVSAGGAGAELWYQIYVFRDRGVTRELVAAAHDCGYRALLLTVDLPVFGWRDRDVASGFTPTDVAPVPMAAAAGGRGPLTPAEFAGLLDQSVGPDDLAELVESSRLPVVAKGVLDPADAGTVADTGAAALVVSNHGGRQLDTVRPTADVLRSVVDAVQGRVEVLVDGGIRRGSDVVKAVALGARGVLVGRPLLWGFAAGGADGVTRALEILLRELDVALALTGVPRLRDVDGRVLPT
jgi:4-hydroxymandelate oxidase